jgi:ABC-type transporter Mla subunit MlaD
MGPLDLIRLPLRALDDLHAIAQEARKAADGRRSTAEALDEALEELRRLRQSAERLDTSARGLQRVAGEIRDGGEELRQDTVRLRDVAREIRDGGDVLRADLEHTSEQLEPVAQLADKVPGSGRRRGRT